MREPCFSTNNPMKQPQGFKAIGDMLPCLLERVRTMHDAISREQAKITTCPSPCSDGSIFIHPRPGETRKMPCPIVKPHCSYGVAMEKELNAYITGLMSLSGVPFRHIGNFSRYRETTASRDGVQWPIRGVLVLCGKPGVGKSFGAAWLVKKHLRNCVDVAYKRALWQKAEIAAANTLWCSAYDIACDKNTAAKAKTIALVVIDDLGKESDSGYAQAAVRDVISKRYDFILPTVVTTELTVLDIKNRYGRAIAERLAEDSGQGGRFIDCGNVSVRLLD